MLGTKAHRMGIGLVQWCLLLGQAWRTEASLRSLILGWGGSELRAG
jgi:hypothetical protein